MKKNTPIHPVLDEDSYFCDGLTAQAYAAIHLKVPESDDSWLNEMILKSRLIDRNPNAMNDIIEADKYLKGCMAHFEAFIMKKMVDKKRETTE